MTGLTRGRGKHRERPAQLLPGCPAPVPKPWALATSHGHRSLHQPQDCPCSPPGVLLTPPSGAAPLQPAVALGSSERPVLWRGGDFPTFSRRPCDCSTSVLETPRGLHGAALRPGGESCQAAGPLLLWDLAFGKQTAPADPPRPPPPHSGRWPQRWSSPLSQLL